MKKKYINRLSLLAFFTGALCAGSAFALGDSKKVDAASITGASVYDFYISGVGVRTVKDEYGDGIRFHTLMSDEMYASLGSGYETGTIFLPELLYDGYLSVDMSNVAKVNTTNIWYDSETDGYMQSTAYIYGIPESYFGAKLIAVSYIKTSDGDYIYSAESPSVSMADVAISAMQKDESLTDALSGYKVEEVTVNYVYGEITTTKTYAYNDVLYPPMEADKEGFDTVWKTKTGKVWDFEKYTATGNMTLTAHYTLQTNSEKTATECAFANGTVVDETAPEGYEKLHSVEFTTADTTGLFANTDITNYSVLKFKAKATTTVYLGANGAKYAAVTADWREFIVTNNNDDTFTVTVDGHGDTYTATASKVSEVFAYVMWAQQAGTLYATEIKGTEKVQSPLAESGLKDFGYKIANTGLASATYDGKFDGVPVFKRTINVSSGGRFGINFDISAYDEVRFNFKHTGFGGTSFIGGNSTQISVQADTWYYVSLRKENGVWQAYMKTDPTAEFTSPYGSGGRPDQLNTANLSEIISFYNWGTMSGDIYLTQVRGSINKEEMDALAVSTLDNGRLETMSAPDGYSLVYGAPFKQTDTAYMFADIDITGFTQFSFKAKGSVGTYLGNMAGYIGLSTDWREVVVTNNNDGTWKITVNGYGDNFTRKASTLKELFEYAMWQGSEGTLYTTELKVSLPEINVMGEEVATTALDDGTIADMKVLSLANDGVVAPNGYEKVSMYTLNGKVFTKGGFADTYIMPYSEIRFKLKSDEWLLLDGTWNNVIDPTSGKWSEYVLIKGAGDSWTLNVYANESETVTFTTTLNGESLQDVLYKVNGSWLNSDMTSNVLYSTEIRGVKDVGYRPADAWATDLGKKAIESGVRERSFAPIGFEKVYSANAWTLSDMDISGYDEVRFAMRTNGFFLWNGWSDVTQHKGVWVEFRLVQNGDKTWNITMDYNGDDADRTIRNVVGSTLAELLPYQISASDKENKLLLDVTEIRAYAVEKWGVVASENALQNGVEFDAARAPTGYSNIYSVDFEPGDTAWMFKNMGISEYALLKFQAKATAGVYIGADGGKYVGLSTDWREYILTNNGDDSWSVTVEGYGDSFTVTANNLKDVFVWTLWANQAGTLYATEIRGEKIAIPESGLADFGEIVLENALVNGEKQEETFDGVAVYKVSIDIANGGKFGVDFDISGYDEIRFDFKHTGFGGTSFIGGNSAQISVQADTWYYVSLEKIDGVWQVYMKTDPEGLFIVPYGNGGRPGDLDYANLANVLSFYNWGTMQGDIYVTEVRGIVNPVTEEPEIPEEPEENLWGMSLGSAVKSGNTSDESVPEGYESVYGEAFNQVDTAYLFADMDISGYTQLKFKAKGSVGTYLGSMSGYIGLGTDWREVVLTNNNDSTFTVTVEGYGDNFTKEASNLKEMFVWTMWQSEAGTLYTTEIRGVEKEKPTLFGENLGSAVKSGNTTEESVPDGYENVYGEAFNKADTAYLFADMDISGYTQLKFKAKGSVGTYLGSMSGYVGLSTDWREVIITNNNDGTFTVTVEGYGDNFTKEASNLKEMFVWTMWQSEAGTLYTTEIRGCISQDLSLMKAKGIAVVDATGKPGYDEYTYAADELQRWAATLFGKELSILTTDCLDEVPSGYFVIGDDLARQAGLGFDDLTTDTGYRIENSDGRVYLYGKTKYGTLNAVYGLFEKAVDLTFFTDTVYTYNATTDIVISVGEYAVFNPSIDYNLAADGVMTMVADDYLTKAENVGATAIINRDSYYNSKYYPNWDYQRRLGFVNSWYIYGSSWHNFTTIMPYEKYGTAHADWYVDITDWSGATVKTLDLSKMSMLPYVAAEFYDLIRKDEAEGFAKTDYIFAPPDSSEWPTANDASKEYVIFMNRLAEFMNTYYDFGREINLMMLAYNSTIVAPSDVTLYNGDEVDVAVMFAPIQANMYRAIDDSTNTSDYYGQKTNSYYFEQLQAWQTIAGDNKDKVYYWNYSTYYDNYFVPMDSISSMQATYQVIAGSGVKMLFDLGQTGDLVASDFAALKTFLKGQLAKNVNATLWTDSSTLKGGLVEKFMDAYYGEASDSMLALLKVEMDWYTTLADEVVFYNSGTASTTGYEAVGHHSGGGQLLWDAKYWDNDDKEGGILGVGKINPDSSMLTTWYGYIKTALSAVEDDAELTRRINVESMPIRYLMYRMFSDYDIDNDGAEDNTKAQLVAFAKSLGIVAFTENTSIDSLA